MREFVGEMTLICDLLLFYIYDSNKNQLIQRKVESSQESRAENASKEEKGYRAQANTLLLLVFLITEISDKQYFNNKSFSQLPVYPLPGERLK